MHKLLMHSYKRTYEPMKEDWYDIQAIKLKAVRQLILQTTSKHHRAFLKWWEYTRHLRSLDSCKRATAFLQIMKEGLM